LGGQREALSFDCLHHTTIAPSYCFIRLVPDLLQMLLNIITRQTQRERTHLRTSARNNIHKLGKTAVAIEPEESL